MKKVTGIGGVFFKCKDPEKIKEWYKTHLGLDTDQYGTTFEWRQAGDPAKKGSHNGARSQKQRNILSHPTKIL